MKRDERQQAIMAILATEGGEVDLDTLAARFDVSKMTIHRDLDELETAGLLRKIRGGATIRSGTQFESDFRFRELQNAPGKAAMADAALELIEPGMTVMINDGSMAAVLGKKCAAKRPLTVMTNNAAVITALMTEVGITLIALGGVYSSKFNAFLGKLTEDSLAELRADIAFVSSPAVDGLEVFHMDDRVVKVKRAMMDRAKTRCLLVNHSRFGQAALYKLARLEEFDHIITDCPPAPDAQRALEAAGLTLTIAQPHEATS
jgi:DeoR/GlpR family transcriptional regulator of sugar metabolism